MMMINLAAVEVLSRETLLPRPSTHRPILFVKPGIPPEVWGTMECSTHNIDKMRQNAAAMHFFGWTH